MANAHHAGLREQIAANAGTPTRHTFVDGYLGNSNPRYAISVPKLRNIAKTWMREHAGLGVKPFTSLITSLNKGESSTEKNLAGILLDYASEDQRAFDPAYFDRWLNHVTGWAEVDVLCTGVYAAKEIPAQWKAWKPLLIRFSKDKNIQKRRASLVLLCSPLLRAKDDRLAAVALQNVNRLKGDKEILITKAISWLLRSMIKHHREMVSDFMNANKTTLPAIAVRETTVKLNTGRKNKTKLTKA